ncbi:DUF6907 domain-containing protein [Nonomuraea rhizosphaerae]|uniref:DUF6907 domain-containing protein n=1 Tax=Nonomuraea rhizosphaerae TaxID=2665663 RepID=UPI001C5CEB57|nr:hypothetical protein [Nonomuraea rhizosphaerae]
MTNRTCVTPDATTTPGCSDAETAQTGIETHGAVEYRVTPRADGLVSYIPTSTPTTSCPPWCSTDHANGIDVEHESSPRDFTGLTVQPGAGERAAVAASLRQMPGQAAHVAFAVCEPVEAQLETEFEVTLEEALRIAYGLLNIVHAARAAARTQESAIDQTTCPDCGGTPQLGLCDAHPHHPKCPDCACALCEAEPE